MAGKSQPRWQLPSGVTRGTMDYVESPAIADDYDEYFAFSDLFQFDEAVVAESIPPTGLVADLGCGTARALVPLVRRGNRGLAVDLSAEMLRVVAEKAKLDDLDITCVQANLVDLSAIETNSVDHAICLFSTLGMIHGAENRAAFLTHVKRILKPGGKFVVHVHNFWFNLFEPSGFSWVMLHLFRSYVRKWHERGDKYYHYRNIPNFFLHVFSRGELLRALKAPGLEIDRVVPLAMNRQNRLRASWLFGGLRASGWIVVCSA
ncbi:class I SAM-dependent methyltransferase [Blastopirellula retiformator]|nr:class I SAM-dependent methyltransferase [Blastopirellula retiformator]